MSVLGLMENTENIAQTTPDLSALPSTDPERFGAAWDAAQSPDRYWNVQSARRQGAAKIIDDLHAQTGERLLNPYDNAPTQDEIRENLGQPTTVIYAKRLEKLRNATRNAKAGMEQFGGLPDDYLDVDSIDAKIAQQSGAARAHDESLTGTGGGVGGFLGSMAGETVSPHGILSSFIPVTRMSTGIAEAGVAAFARNVGKEALFQGGTQAAAQSMATLVDYNTRKPFGTEQTNQQIIDEIVSAGAGGALLGGLMRGAHLGILKLASRGVEIPPAVLDSARVLEERDLYGDKNPLRINPGQNEVATDQATSAAAMGRAATPDVDVAPAAPAAGAAPAPSSTGLGELGGAAKAMSANLYEGLYGALEKGETKFAGITDPVLAAARADFEAGRIKSPEDLADFVNKRGAFAPAEGATPAAEARPGAPAAATEAVAAPPVPAAEAEQAVADARRAGAAAEAAAPGEAAPQAPAAGEAAPVEGARTREAIGNEITAREDELKAKHGSDYVGYRLEARDDPQLAALHAEYDALPEVAARDARDMAARQAELERLTKSIEDTPDNPMQAPRPTPPEPKAQPATPKAPGESAEDKAVLQQAQQVLDSKTAAVVDPNLRRTMELADIEESQATAAVACLAGAI